MNSSGLDPELKPYVSAALGRKAMDPVVLDVRHVTDVADVFVICSGRSNRQVSAIAEFIERDLKKAGIRSISTEGVKDGQWVLIDYGHVVIHIFYDPVRRFYDLESLWADAARIDISEMISRQQQGQRKTDDNE
ncbi:MAG: ribosome silencing factor [Desulfobacterales bacterium]